MNLYNIFSSSVYDLLLSQTLCSEIAHSLSLPFLYCNALFSSDIDLIISLCCSVRIHSFYGSLKQNYVWFFYLLPLWHKLWISRGMSENLKTDKTNPTQSKLIRWVQLSTNWSYRLWWNLFLNAFTMMYFELQTQVGFKFEKSTCPWTAFWSNQEPATKCNVPPLSNNSRPLFAGYIGVQCWETA